MRLLFAQGFAEAGSAPESSLKCFQSVFAQEIFMPFIAAQGL